jgi:hypothetical protein
MATGKNWEDSFYLESEASLVSYEVRALRFEHVDRCWRAAEAEDQHDGYLGISMWTEGVAG